MGPQRRLTSVTPFAALLGVVIVVSGIAGGRTLHAARVDHARAQLGADLGEAIVVFDEGLDDVVTALVDPQHAPGDVAARLREAPEWVTAVAQLEGPAQQATPVASAPAAHEGEVDALVGDPQVAAFLGAVTDAGRTRVGSIATALAGQAIAARPIYEPGAAVATTEERRAALSSFVVALVDVGVLLSASLGSGVDGAVAVRAADGALASRGAVGDEDLALALRMPGGSGEQWVMSGSAPISTGAAPLVAPAAATALALTVLAMAVRTDRERRRAASEAAERDAELEQLVDVGRLLQRSLDLAEILPALGVTLVDRLHLDGCSVLVADERGDLVEAFAMGERPAAPPARASDIPPPPDAVEPGGTVALAVERAGRAVGALWLAPREGLAGHQLAAARAITEIVGSAIVNAGAFERERDTARRMAELDQMKSDFLSTVSHELRTPATAIQGFGSILETSWERLDEAGRRDLVERIARNARSLSAMLSGLLDFARIERMSMQVERRAIDLGEVVAATVTQTTSLIEQHDVVIDVEPQLVVWADPQAIERITSNLLTNAAKYSPPGTTVRVAVARDGQRALLSVSDEGAGVPHGERGRIFSRFYRGEGQATLRTRGAGIGLAVVKELVDRHDAEVDVVDAPSGGARFRVWFALGAPAGADRHDAEGGGSRGHTP